MSADKYGKGLKKADKELSARRVDKVIELISLCKPTGEIIRHCSSEWGVSTRQADIELRAVQLAGDGLARELRQRDEDRRDRRGWGLLTAKFAGRGAWCRTHCPHQSSA